MPGEGCDSPGCWPRISPIPQGVERPFWSVMIPTYNPSLEYLEQVIRSVLQQGIEPAQMQIELVDDHSRDFAGESFVRTIGDTRVSFHRHRQRLGMAGNWNACIQRARGHWIHIMHQDDLVLEGFYRSLRAGIERHPTVGAAFTQLIFIDGDGKKLHDNQPTQILPGILMDWPEHVYVALKIQCPAIVVKRTVYETLGGFDPSFTYCMDWDMWKRVAANFPIWHDPAPLACYREHAASTTAELTRAARIMAELRRSIDATSRYLPASIAPEVARRERRHLTLDAVSIASRCLLHDRDPALALIQLWQARRISSSLEVTKCLFVKAKWAWRRRYGQPWRRYETGIG